MFLQPHNIYIQSTLPIPLSHPRHKNFTTAKQEVSQDVTSRDGIHLLQQLCEKLETRIEFAEVFILQEQFHPC
jgi:hypothetical protein